MAGLVAALSLEFRPGAPPPRHMGTLVVALAFCGWGFLDMLVYVANLLFLGGCGIYEQRGKIVCRFPFLTAVGLQDVIGVGVGTNFAFKDAPDYIYLTVKGGRRLKIPMILYKTPFESMISTLEALGVPRIPDTAGTPESLP